MPYRLPTFNVLVRIWASPQNPADPPRAVVYANLGATDYKAWEAYSDLSYYGAALPVRLFFPRGTDIRDGRNGGPGDTIEAPMGTGAFYRIIGAGVRALGFPNEHVVAIALPRRGFPEPYPSL
jgi:hypothetical protein